MKKFMMIALALSAVLYAGVVSADYSVSFYAQDIKTAMANQSAPLSDATYQWGLWAVRAMPIVTGGTYTITGGSTTQTGWGGSAGAFGATPYSASNSAWFRDASGSEAGLPANPLYMIMSQPANTFTSYTFALGTNVVTAVNDNALMTFTFTLGSGATWAGGWQFVVDGTKYTLGTSAAPGTWVGNFFGGYNVDSAAYGYTGNGGGLANNMVAGYTGYSSVPIPAAVWLLGSGLLGLIGIRRRFKK